MQRVGRMVAVLAMAWAGCAASDSTVTSSSPIGTADASAADASSGAMPSGGTTGGNGSEPAPTTTPDAAVDADVTMPVTPTGDACMDAALRIAGCFLSRTESGTAACIAGASDAAPTVARFLIAGDSCGTLTMQGIVPTTPCDQAPLPQHVAQLVGFEAAATLCKNGPVNTAAVCNAACENLPPCVDEKMLDEKLKDAARCFDGCIRNTDDKTAFACSAQHKGDCTALAEQCWTAP